MNVSVGRRLNLGFGTVLALLLLAGLAATQLRGMSGPALVEQSAAAAESLKDQSTRLSGLVGAFTLVRE